MQGRRLETQVRAVGLRQVLLVTCHSTGIPESAISGTSHAASQQSLQAQAVHAEGPPGGTVFFSLGVVPPHETQHSRVQSPQRGCELQDTRVSGPIDTSEGPGTGPDQTDNGQPSIAQAFLML